MAKKHYPKEIYRNVKVQIKFNETEFRELEEMCNELNMSKQEFIRHIIRRLYAQIKL